MSIESDASFAEEPKEKRRSPFFEYVKSELAAGRHEYMRSFVANVEREMLRKHDESTRLFAREKLRNTCVNWKALVIRLSDRLHFEEIREVWLKCDKALAWLSQNDAAAEDEFDLQRYLVDFFTRPLVRYLRSVAAGVPERRPLMWFDEHETLSDTPHTTPCHCPHTHTRMEERSEPGYGSIDLPGYAGDVIYAPPCNDSEADAVFKYPDPITKTAKREKHYECAGLSGSTESAECLLEETI